MTASLPEHVKKYGETPIFTQETVPEKLTKVHDTKAGVWGRLVVLEGGLDYIIIGPPEKRLRADKSLAVIIEPSVLHYVSLYSSVRFKIEFFK